MSRPWWGATDTARFGRGVGVALERLGDIGAEESSPRDGPRAETLAHPIGRLQRPLAARGTALEQGHLLASHELTGRDPQ